MNEIEKKTNYFQEPMEDEIENDFEQNISELDKQNYDIDNELIEYLPYTSTNSKRDNETSGISLLKELEDKWDNIEKKKQQVNRISKNKRQNATSEYKKANLKSMIDECKHKFMKKIQIMRTNYNKNKDEFETFANETIMKMENIKIQNDKIKYQLEALEESTKDDNIQDNPTNPNQQINKNIKQEKTFLKPDNPQKVDTTKIPLAYRGNLFTCKEMTSIEGLVYETPSTTEGKKELETNNFTISESLANKIKSVFEDITTPFQPIVTQNNFSENGKNEPNEEDLSSAQNTMTNKNQNINTNNNSVNIHFNSANSLYHLEKNFDSFVTKIKPNFNSKITGKIIEIKNDDSQNKIEEDEYFENLTKEAGFKKHKTKSNNLEKVYSFTNFISDKKFSKKIEENVKLLNNVMSGEAIYKKKIKNNVLQNRNGLLNASYLRNHSVSLMNNSNTNSIIQDNRIFSKNKFEDTISKIYKANATKIQKIINNK